MIIIIGQKHSKRNAVEALEQNLHLLPQKNSFGIKVFAIKVRMLTCNAV
jgi:hypothetical protein